MTLGCSGLYSVAGFIFKFALGTEQGVYLCLFWPIVFFYSSETFCLCSNIGSFWYMLTFKFKKTFQMSIFLCRIFDKLLFEII